MVKPRKKSLSTKRLRRKPAAESVRITAALQSADCIAKASRVDVYLAVVAPVGIRRESFLSSLVRVLAPFGYPLDLGSWRSASRTVNPATRPAAPTSTEEPKSRGNNAAPGSQNRAA